MLEPFFILLQNLPFGLLLAALLLESFIVSKNRREVEPAVLWLLFCSICASGLVILVSLGMFFAAGDTSRLHDGFWSLLVVAVASLAWYFKRQSRNRGLLRLGERFYSQDPKEPPKPKPGQHFWILGWRTLAVAALLAGIGSLLRIKPGFSLSKYEKQPEIAAATPAPAPPAPANPSAAVPPVAPPPAEPAKPASLEGSANAVATTPPAETTPATPPAAVPADVDPTKSEIPSDEASAAAAKMAATPTAPEPGTPVVTPAPAPPPAPAETARPVSRNSIYFAKVRPIFAKACIKCHGAEKHKGDLALHNPDAIRAGINGKPAIIPGNPEKSRVYACVILPPDDTDFMPSKGQPLSVTDKKTLFDWIKSGADLGDGVSIPGGGGGVFTVDALSEGLKDVDQALLESLTREHVIIRPLSKNKRVVEVDFSHSDRMYSDLKLSELAPMALNIYALDLSRTKVKDADLAALSGMKNLQTLILSKTEISDAGIAHLAGNTALESLNLYNTMVSDAAIPGLSGLKALKKVFVWNSKVTDAGVKQLQEAIPGVSVNSGAMAEKITPPPRPAAPRKP
ncbi:MAG TPA: c-type cytochrome domain-containing protein [Verrucomicrobiales bacterium]|nr:c-type cytochrome domain-containing protein [Verrucomicrobiales bacterium]